MNAPSRRHLLNAMGLSASSLFLPSLWGDRRAQAQSTPKRLLVFYTPHGPVQQRWQMRSGAPQTWGDTRTKPDRNDAFEFSLKDHPEDKWSHSLKPLYPLRNKIVALEGLAMTSALLDVTTNNHNAGTAHALTASRMRYPAGFKMEGAGGGSSIDQVVATKIADPERIRSFYFTTGGWSPVFRDSIEQKGETAPDRAYDKLFPVSLTGDPTLDLVKQHRASAVSMVSGQYKKFSERLGGDDRKKLQTHFDLVADLERSIKFRSTAGAQCAARPPMAPPPAGSRPQKEVVTDFGKLIAAAFSCDMTRVAVMSLGQPATADLVTSLNIHTDLHADVAHSATPDHTRQYGQMADYYRFLAEQYASLLGLLDGIPVDGGRTLLDDTVCLWLCELANGVHEMQDIMAVVAGSGSTFKTGRYVKFAEKDKNPRGAALPPVGPPHTRLLTSIAQAFGVEGTQVGSKSQDFMATNRAAADFDLAGPLAGLKA